MLDMHQDGVVVINLPDTACCKLDERKSCPLELDECPKGEKICSGDCFYYSENPEDKCCEYLEPDEQGDICHADDYVECPEVFEGICSAKYDMHGNSLNEMAEDEWLRGGY